MPLPRWLADPRRIILLAPVLFALHVAEEAPGLVAYMNALVEPDIDQPLFLQVNAVGLVITLAVVAWLAAAGEAREASPAIVALAWLSFLMFANAIFHILASILYGYSPGTLTAAALYLPFFVLCVRRIRRRYALSWALIATVTLLGGMPMFIHGYLIAFRGSRLF